MEQKRTQNSNYIAYINSAVWKAKRLRVLERAGFVCENCKSSVELEVHHVTYLRFGGNERPADLLALCKACHREVHGMKPLLPTDKRRKVHFDRIAYARRKRSERQLRIQIAKQQ